MHRWAASSAASDGVHPRRRAEGAPALVHFAYQTTVPIGAFAALINGVRALDLHLMSAPDDSYLMSLLFACNEVLEATYPPAPEPFAVARPQPERSTGRSHRSRGEDRSRVRQPAGKLRPPGALGLLLAGAG